MIFKKLKEFKRKYGQPHSIIITGGGEPFMNNQIGEIVKLCREYGFEFGVYSNGTKPDIVNQICEVIKYNPTFFRISVNAGSKEEHNSVYQKPSVDIEDIGKNISAYEMVKHNSKTVVDEIREKKADTVFGYGYIFNGTEKKETYLGMKEFAFDMSKKLKGFPFYMMIRNKMEYYEEETGKPIRIVPKECDYKEVSLKTEKYLNGLPKEVTVQVNEHSIKLMDDFKKKKALPEKNCVATGWATSFTHKGEGFITSELNGSKFKNSMYCSSSDFEDNPFESIWFGEKRKGICNSYCKGKILTPLYHKVASLNMLLLEIRRKVGF